MDTKALAINKVDPKKNAIHVEYDKDGLFYVWVECVDLHLEDKLKRQAHEIYRVL